VITLAAPSVPAGKWGFVLGESDATQLDVIDSELRSRKVTKAGLILEGQGAQLALSRPLFIPPRACDFRSGDLASTKTWAVFAPPACTHRVFEDLGRSGGTIALSLRSVVSERIPSTVAVIGIAAGKFPARSDDAELLQYAQRFGGKPTWWTVLGRDAAALGRVAVRNLPTDATSSPSEVVRRREIVRSALESASVELWSTSEAQGFGKDHLTKRTLKAIVLH
jgi:hypothetical protein